MPRYFFCFALCACGTTTSPQPPATVAELGTPPVARTDAEPELVLMGEDIGDGEARLQVRNLGGATVSLALGVSIEVVRLEGGTYSSEAERVEALAEYTIGPEWFFLTEDCVDISSDEHGQESSRCVRIPVGETLNVVPWSGYNSSVQCERGGGLMSDFPSPSGTYRFVARACQGSRTYESNEFDHQRTENP